MRKWLPGALVVLVLILFGVFLFTLFTPTTGDPAPTAPTTQTPPMQAPPSGTPPVVSPPLPGSPEAGVSAQAAAAKESLSRLGTTVEEPDVKYDRVAKFGRAWIDTDGNGCDTRNDILQRDLVPFVTDGPCRVISGTLKDPYTGKVINFIRGQKTSNAVQIDHIIALSWAWKNGAWKWDEDTRIFFANDPANLLASDGPTNGSKSDKGPGVWMPPLAEYHCTYSLKTTEVLVKYNLTVPNEDYMALIEGLNTCAE